MDEQEGRTQAQEASQQRQPHGFARLSDARRREIASEGGKTAHQLGRAHQFTSIEARAAGSKGGKLAHLLGRAHRFTSEEARVAGRKGARAAQEMRELRRGVCELPDVTGRLGRDSYASCETPKRDGE